jgi:hypothetical protein
MCLKPNCRSIDIVEIRDNVKVVLHYDDTYKPILIQYWDETKTPHTQVLFEPTPRWEEPKIFIPSVNRTLIFDTGLNKINPPKYYI